MRFQAHLEGSIEGEERRRPSWEEVEEEERSIGELSRAAHEEEGVGVVAAGPLHLRPGGAGGGGKR